MCAACWLASTRNSILGVAALAATARTLLLRQRGRLNQLTGQLEALSPLAILDRGYALVFDPSGALLKDAGQ